MSVGIWRSRVVAAYLSIASAGLVLSGCAAPQGGTQGFDGVYRGTRTQISGSPGCAGSNNLVMHVAGSHIWVNSRHVHQRMEGSVGQDGQVSLADDRGQHVVTAVMTAAGMSGTETVGGNASSAGTAQACVLRIDAVRTSGPGNAQE